MSFSKFVKFSFVNYISVREVTLFFTFYFSPLSLLIYIDLCEWFGKQISDFETTSELSLKVHNLHPSDK